LGLWHCGQMSMAGAFLAVWLKRCAARDLLFLRLGKGPMFRSLGSVYLSSVSLAHRGSVSSAGQSHFPWLRL